MELIIVSVLAMLVVLGSVTISWGARHFNLSHGVLAVAFTLTAVSWLAFLITAIGITIKTIALAQI
ncbi:MAG: hypothetical protein RLZZ387_4352 [Chloroflexota bacterium]|jgi:hypothetical protein